MEYHATGQAVLALALASVLLAAADRDQVSMGLEERTGAGLAPEQAPGASPPGVDLADGLVGGWRIFEESA